MGILKSPLDVKRKSLERTVWGAFAQQWLGMGRRPSSLCPFLCGKFADER